MVRTGTGCRPQEPTGGFRRGAGHPRGDQPGGALADPPADHRRKWSQRRDRHPGGHVGDRRCRVRGGPRRSRRYRRGAARARSGAAIGVAVGVGGGWLLRRARRSHWAAEDFTGIAVLALALLVYTVAVSLHGNGFVAAFCGGLAFGAVAGRRGRRSARTSSRRTSSPRRPLRPRVRTSYSSSRTLPS